MATNEELAIQAQQGDKQALALLWEQVKRLVGMKCRSFYNMLKNRADKAGVTQEDMLQESYIAFTQAVKAYKADGEYKFTSYLNYPLKNQFNVLLGYRTVSSKNNPLNSGYVPLDKPISENGDTLLLDSIGDETSEIPFEQIELTEVERLVFAALAQLNEQEQEVIRLRYWKELSLESIAKRINVTKERVRQVELRALRNLRQSPALRNLYKSFNIHYEYVRISRFDTSPEYFDIVQDLRKREAQGEYISYGNQIATIQSEKRKYENKVARGEPVRDIVAEAQKKLEAMLTSMGKTLEQVKQELSTGL